jgi:ankyrin repeat protein
MDVNYRGSDGDTPLIRSAYYNSPETVTLLLQHGADTHHRVNEFESFYSYATAMYYACFYGPFTVCPLVTGEIRRYGVCCPFLIPLTCVANPCFGYTFGLFCLCPCQTIPRMTDCERTWKYCITPIILLPETCVEECSLLGNRPHVIPTTEDKDKKDLEEMTKDVIVDDTTF